MKMKGLLILVCVLIFGCATDDKLMKPQTLPTVAKPVVLTPTQIGEEAPAIKPGTKFTFRQGNVITKQWNTVVWEFREQFMWQGREAYLIDTTGGQGGQFMIWDRFLNMMATADSQGKVISAFEPCVKLFTFPMKVGLTYTATYDYWTAGKKMGSISEQIKIDAKEVVRVPAGSYNAFIIKREATKVIEYHYYAPMLGFPVKWVWSQAVDHPNGAGEFVTELVKVETVEAKEKKK